MMPGKAPAMKLFFIVENDEPHASGGGFYALFKFAEFLARKGHKVMIYSVHDMHWVKPGTNLTLCFRPSLPRRGRVLSKLDRYLSRLSERWILPFIAIRFRPDWILGVLTYSAIKAETLGLRFSVPVANFVYECPLWMREIFGEDVYRQAQNAFSVRLWESTRKAYLGSRVLFPNSSLSGEYTRKWLCGKLVADPIHPGIDPEQMPIEAPVREPVRMEGGNKHLLYVGRLVESKNVGDLIAAASKLVHNAVIHICGVGPDMERLKKLAPGSSSICFHGFVSDDDLWSLFRQCDLVVYPTGFEGFGMPPMQALYFGKPCIASDLAIFRVVFGDRLEYFPVGDVDALARAIDSLLDAPEYCRERGESGRKFILENFTWMHAAVRIEKTLVDTAACESNWPENESLVGSGPVLAK